MQEAELGSKFNFISLQRHKGWMWEIQNGAGSVGKD